MERADFPGLGTGYLLRGDETGGRFAMLEHTIPPRRLAAPMHTHEREDEFSLVLEGLWAPRSATGSSRRGRAT